MGERIRRGTGNGKGCAGGVEDLGVAGVPGLTKLVGTGPVSGPVPVWAGTKPVQIQNSNLNSKK